MSGWKDLPWDSGHFGFPIGLVDPTHQVADVVLGADRAGVRCLYLLLPADDLGGLEAARGVGFTVRDLRVTLVRPIAAWRSPPCGAISPAKPSERATIEGVAASAFALTRFRADPGFAVDRVDAMYSAWVRAALDATEPDRAVLAAVEGRAFVACSVNESVGFIDLVAVGAGLTGRGYASTLLDAAITWCAKRGARTMEVVTQGSNVPAQRLYQRTGFATRSAEVWLHRWSSPALSPFTTPP